MVRAKELKAQRRETLVSLAHEGTRNRPLPGKGQGMRRSSRGTDTESRLLEDTPGACPTDEEGSSALL